MLKSTLLLRYYFLFASTELCKNHYILFCLDTLQY